MIFGVTELRNLKSKIERLEVDKLNYIKLQDSYRILEEAASNGRLAAASKDMQIAELNSAYSSLSNQVSLLDRRLKKELEDKEKAERRRKLERIMLLISVGLSFIAGAVI